MTFMGGLGRSASAISRPELRLGALTGAGPGRSASLIAAQDAPSSAKWCGLGKGLAMLPCLDLDSLVGAADLCGDLLRGEVLLSKLHQLHDLLGRPALAMIGPIRAHGGQNEPVADQTDSYRKFT